MLKSVSRICSLAASLLMFSGCSLLPAQGPTAMGMAFHQTKGAVSRAYTTVTLDAAALARINVFQPVSFPSEFRGALGGGRATTLGVGDRVIVNIWEPSQDGVFATAEKKQTTLQVVIDEDGQIYIPYAGRIQAAGRKIESLRSAIEARLKGKAVEPQVQVLLDDNMANAVVVIGDIASPGRFAVPIRGLRLMEAIAQAGGTREATFETIATVMRAGRSGTARLDELMSIPANNIWLAPGDTVLVLHKPRTYSAFGAVRTSGLIPFRTETVWLIEALAQAGGLVDMRADAGGVFILRFEDPDLARALTKPGQPHIISDGTSGGATPVIYRLDFQNPEAFFIAQSFRMRDKDVLYVANHPAAEFGKFLSTIVSPLLGTARATTALGS